ncbi:ABC-type transport system, involved in lipoprotein release, permease component [Desulfosporosinus orientis DSM 765]|uniref:ABC-type transport system, involved in lipoprotein release, permease component n=1 Tax=Desulfosporosinus orientis (strain ATCC 19365 / DSM 765 / NCIMB 8382 / VKM B-1628 / Singapore I) TaxID=768706 RepID=G7W593_DESOD|nr:ABC transporter permease [Desulfosporosinus orientis]AET66321.1 ABC-type transport system, involved in lipoprotein release, permease component [Desulfosporosinus orientis DSM 765]
MLRESMKMAWNNIVHNKMRSFLTVLGVLIGVASIIALITIVQGATGSITSQISSLGADKITIQVMGTRLKQGLSENDLKLLSEVENVSGVSPTVSGKIPLVFNRNLKQGVSVQGKNEIYLQKEKDILAKGRVINSMDVSNKNPVAILGSDLAKELFFGIDPMGQQLLLNGHTVTLIGVLKETSASIMGSTNHLIILPYTSAMKIMGVRSISNVDVYMRDANQSEKITNDLTSILNSAFNYRENAFTVLNMQNMIDVISNITGMLTLLLAGIASISLIVGGIGIMNMMLVSVTERTTEIGLRKALGAEPSQIQLQFLIESIFISLFGGILGLLIGMSIAFAASILMKFTFVMTAWTIILAVGFSAAVGIIFGLAPARKASRLNPIDALRHV